MRMFHDESPVNGSNHPSDPVQNERGFCSSSSIAAQTTVLGQPVIEPPGKIFSTASKTSTSGLKNILEVLDKESDIGITHFDSQDVVRHPLVRKIINAYRRYNEAIKDDKD